MAAERADCGAAPPGERIAKRIARAGLCSRRDAERADRRRSGRTRRRDRVGSGHHRRRGERDQRRRRPPAGAGARPALALSQAARPHHQPSRPAGPANGVREGSDPARLCRLGGAAGPSTPRGCCCSPTTACLPASSSFRRAAGGGATGSAYAACRTRARSPPLQKASPWTGSAMARSRPASTGRTGRTPGSPSRSPRAAIARSASCSRISGSR